MAGGSNELRLVASIDLSRITRSIRQLRNEVQSSLNESALSSFNRGLATAAMRAGGISSALRQTQVEARATVNVFNRITSAIPTGRILSGLTAAFGFNELRRGFATIEDASLRLQNVAGSADLARRTVFALSRAASDAGLNFGQLSSQLVALQQVASSSGFGQAQSLDLAQDTLRAGRALSGTSVQGTQAIIRNIERIISQQRFGSFELRPLLFAGVQEREIFEALGVGEDVGRRLLASNTPIIQGGQAQQVAGFSADQQVQVTANELGANLARIVGDRLPADFQTLSGSFNQLRNSVGEFSSAVGTSTRTFPLLTESLTVLSNFINGITDSVNQQEELAGLFGQAGAPRVLARGEQAPGVVASLGGGIAITPDTPNFERVDFAPVLRQAINESGELSRGESIEQFLARATMEQIEALNERILRILNRDQEGPQGAQGALQQTQVEAGTQGARSRAIINQNRIQRRNEAAFEQAAEELRQEARNREAEIAIRGVSSAIGELTRSAIQARQPLQDILQQFLDTLLQTATNSLASGLNESINNILYPDKAASAIQQRATANATPSSS